MRPFGLEIRLCAVEIETCAVEIEVWVLEKETLALPKLVRCHASFLKLPLALASGQG